ncbi:MAG TPA: TetR/AcrR family transcriptional regulator [Bordetella sp.]
MSRQRLTREESREQTRRRLLDSAAALLAKKGLAATSVEDIAKHAGYTRGAFYSNFKSKVDLFIDLLKCSHQHIQQDLQGLLDADIQGEDLRQQLVQFYARCHGDAPSYVLWAEARLYAARDAKFRQRLNQLYLEKREVIAYFITQFCQKMGTAPPAPAEDLALGLIALADGVFYFNLSMPALLPDGAAQSLLSVFFTSTFFGARA